MEHCSTQDFPVGRRQVTMNRSGRRRRSKRESMYRVIRFNGVTTCIYIKEAGEQETTAHLDPLSCNNFYRLDE